MSVINGNAQFQNMPLQINNIETMQNLQINVNNNRLMETNAKANNHDSLAIKSPSQFPERYQQQLKQQEFEQKKRETKEYREKEINGFKSNTKETIDVESMINSFLQIDRNDLLESGIEKKDFNAAGEFGKEFINDGEQKENMMGKGWDFKKYSMFNEKMN